MLKKEIVRMVAEKAKVLNQKTVERTFDAIFEVIAGCVKKGEKIKIEKFGVFSAENGKIKFEPFNRSSVKVSGKKIKNRRRF